MTDSLNRQSHRRPILWLTNRRSNEVAVLTSLTIVGYVLTIAAVLVGCGRVPDADPQSRWGYTAQLMKAGDNAYSPIPPYRTYVQAVRESDRDVNDVGVAVNELKEAVRKARHDHGRAYQARRIQWGRLPGDDNDAPFEQVRGVVFVVRCASGADKGEIVNWITIVPVGRLFDESIPVETLVTPSSVQRDAFKSYYSEENRRYEVSIPNLDESIHDGSEQSPPNAHRN